MPKNIVYQSAIYAKGNVHIGDVYIIQGTPQQIPLRLNTIPYIDQEDVIGRNDDLQNVRQLMYNSEKVVLVNGLGGIGKTTLAKYFTAQFRETYNYVAWIDATSNIKEAFINNVQLIDSLCLREELEALPKNDLLIDSAFSLVINRMRQLGGDSPTKTNLLIIDNAGEDIEHTQTLDQITLRPNWKVLVTSREKLIGFTEYELGFLSPEDAKQLFYFHYKREKNDSGVSEILKKIDYHTLLIEVIAKTGQSLRLNLEDILDRLKKKGLNISEEDKSIKFPHHYNQKVFDVFEYLLEMFQLANLSDYEQWVMMQFAVLPSKFISYENNFGENILAFLQIAKGEKRDGFTRAINGLVEKGWLQWESKNDRFKMHALTQEIIRYKLAPDTAKCSALIETFKNNLHLKGGENIFLKKYNTTYAEAILINIYDHSLKLADLSNDLAVFFRRLGMLGKAIYFFERVMAIHEKLGELDHPSMAFTYDGLAIAYGEMSDFEKSLQFFLKANQIFKKYPGEEFLDYAISCDNVGVCYRKMNQLDQALVYSKKAVGFLKGASIKKKETHINHHLAIAYSNLAAIYQIKGRLEEALTYNNKSLEIKKTIPNNDPLGIALSYSALGDVYRGLNEMDKALQFGKKAENILVNMEDSIHPLSGRIFKNLSLIYRDLQEDEEAIKYVDKALSIFEETFSKENPELRAAIELKSEFGSNKRL